MPAKSAAKKQIISLYNVVTQDLVAQGFVRRENAKFFEGGKHYVPYVRELDSDKALTLDVAKRESLYVLVTFQSVGMPEEINADDDWAREDWKTRNHEIFLTCDDASLNSSCFRVSTGPSITQLPEPERRPAKVAKLAAPAMSGNITEDEDVDEP
jgi:hypothetical protein